MRNQTARIVLAAVFYLLLMPFLVFCEGTKQVIPVASGYGKLCIDKSRNDFAFYDGLVDYRLNIAIGDTSESFRFGFGAVDPTYLSELSFRIKDPSGNVVFGPQLVPGSGAGHINTYEEAVNGPFPEEGGYSYLVFDPLTTGDHYLEFFYLPLDPSNGYVHDEMHRLEYFDSTVIRSDGKAVDGRVWSKAWQFWSENPDLTTSSFYGKMMIFSDDSIVTQLNCNGFRGGTFSISSNMSGCANTGNLSHDRKSRVGFFTYPQYKIFLNDPDSNLFPAAEVSSAVVGSPVFTPDCTTGGGTIGITVIKDGTVRILLETNPTPGADPEDAEIVASVKSGGGYNLSTGCASMTGCHTWTKYIGDNNTINSWWYIKLDDIAPVYATSQRIPGMLSVEGSEIFCPGSGMQEYSVTPDPSSSFYQWSFAGSGVLITGSGTEVFLDFSPGATSGALSVYGHNKSCGDGPAGSFDITVAPQPDVRLDEFSDVCYTAPAFQLEGGQPAGGTYFVDGIQSDSLFPYKEPEGVHTIVYTYSYPNGCNGSDTVEILLRTDSDCEGFLMFPNVFTPNGDGSNDVFKPAVMENIFRFRMEIYNRWGQLICTMEDVTGGWDGTYGGKECPVGLYIYAVTYGLSLRTDDNGKIKGVLTLLR